MDSVVSVSDSAVLTIEPGTTVYFRTFNEDNKISVLGINQGCRLIAEGTREAPIVFTSDRVNTRKAANGGWGGLVINGKAPVNSGVASIGDGFRYGGTDPSEGTNNASKNGLVKYMRIEYAADRAFRLSNVGAATQIDYVQIFKSSGEGIMITDGNAGLKHIVATDCEGGSYRLGDAYSGNMQFIVSVNSAYFNENDDFTIREEASPVLSNVTLLGPGEDVNNTHGLRMRADAKPKVHHSVVAEFPRRGVRSQDNVTITDLQGTAVFAYSYVFNVDHDPFKDDAVDFSGTFDPTTGERLTNPFFNNVDSIQDDGDYELVPIAGIGIGDFVPDAETASDFDPSTLGSFFTSAPYPGAVRNADGDWTKGWVKNPDGTLR